jgi:hypothetical protein
MFPRRGRRAWASLAASFREIARGQQRAAAAPSGQGSRVPDLSLHEEGGQAVFTWSYRQHGDYDINGAVTVSDLTQVGIHFGQTTLDADWQVAQLADGDGNGEVGVSDVTPIGQNRRLRLRAAGPQRSGSTSAKADLPFAPGDKLSGLSLTLCFRRPRQDRVPRGAYVDNGDGANKHRKQHGPDAYGFDDYWHTVRQQPPRQPEKQRKNKPPIRRPGSLAGGQRVHQGQWLAAEHLHQNL